MRRTAALLLALSLPGCGYFGKPDVPAPAGVNSPAAA